MKEREMKKDSEEKLKPYCRWMLSVRQEVKKAYLNKKIVYLKLFISIDKHSNIDIIFVSGLNSS